MKKPSDSEIQAFQIGLDYAVQTLNRIEHEYRHCSAADLRAEVSKDLMMVKHRQMMAKDALTTRLPVNNRPANHHAQFKCGVCNGVGKIGEPGNAFGNDVECKNCGGSGKVSNDNPAAVKVSINVAGHFTDARIGDDGQPEFSFVPSDATMGRIEILRDLLETMDGVDNPDAAESWKGLRTHIKAKLIGWKNQAGQEPHKPFSERPIFSPKQLEESKAKAQRVGFLAAASWINGVLREAVEKLTPVQVNTGLAHALHKVLNEDAELSIKLITGLTMLHQAAMDKPGPPRGRTVLEGREGDETEESKP